MPIVLSTLDRRMPRVAIESEAALPLTTMESAPTASRGAQSEIPRSVRRTIALPGATLAAVNEMTVSARSQERPARWTLSARGRRELVLFGAVYGIYLAGR